MQSRSSGNMKGIDVSHWDGEINYNTVKDQGIKVVYIKATQGETSVDTYFKSNAVKAKEAGLLVGFYHFLNPSTEESARKQAAHFVETIKPYHCDCRLALDMEVNKGLSASNITNLSKIFLEEVKRLSGLDVVIYSYTSFIKENLQKSLNVYPLWVAHYGVNTPGSNGVWDSWVGFQYSEKGHVRGIGTECDLNEFTQGILLPRKNEPVKQPTITPVPAHKPQSDKQNHLIYTVKKGDTLDKIAIKYNTTITNLVKLNNIKNPNLIFVGQVIKIK